MALAIRLVKLSREFCFLGSVDIQSIILLRSQFSSVGVRDYCGGTLGCFSIAKSMSKSLCKGRHKKSIPVNMENPGMLRHSSHHLFSQYFYLEGMLACEGVISFS